MLPQLYGVRGMAVPDIETGMLSNSSRTDPAGCPMQPVLGAETSS